MFWTVFFAIMGGCGLTLAAFRGTRVDAYVEWWIARLRQVTHDEDQEIILLGRLISGLRAGLTLDTILENVAKESETLRRRLYRILHSNPENDFLSRFLTSALQSGVPLLQTLQSMEGALRAKKKLRLKAKSISSQCRAQAEVLSWLPWALAVSIAFVDGDWVWSASHSPLSWLFWAGALALTGIGRKWLAISMSRALAPRNLEEKLEETSLSEFTLQIIAQVSQGCDVESATELALSLQGNPQFSQHYHLADPQSGRGKLSRLKSVLNHAARSGAPLREELTGFLNELQLEVEARWEERAQRLPIVLLAPLFLCFFPSSLLMLAGLFAPLVATSL